MDPSASLLSISFPLAYQPGTSWLYSVAHDWVGKLVERVSNLSLEDYFRQNVFDKVEGGMKDTSFFPTKSIAERKMGMCTRVEGQVKVMTTWGVGRPQEEERVNKDLLCGGLGLFGTMRDYLAFLRTVLRCDPRYGDSNPLLQAESYAELFKGSLGSELGKEQMVAQLSPPGYLDPPPTPDTADYSVGMCLRLVDSVGGRRKGSGFWSGMAKTQYWIDPATGIAVGQTFMIRY